MSQAELWASTSGSSHADRDEMAASAGSRATTAATTPDSDAAGLGRSGSRARTASRRQPAYFEDSESQEDFEAEDALEHAQLSLEPGLSHGFEDESGDGGLEESLPSAEPAMLAGSPPVSPAGLPGMPAGDDGQGTPLARRSATPGVPETPLGHGRSKSMQTDPTMSALVAKVKDIRPDGYGGFRRLRDIREAESPSVASRPASSLALVHAGTPGGSGYGGYGGGGGGDGLTLKEQSSLIDKLQKDNWGFQLKIYILQEELAKRSDESVKDLMTENVEMKTTNVGLNLELKKLRKQLDAARRDGRDFDANEASLASARELEYLREQLDKERGERARLERELTGARDGRAGTALSLHRPAGESELRDQLAAVKLVSHERKMQVDLLAKENAELQDMYESLTADYEFVVDEKERLEGEIIVLLKETQAREEDLVGWQEDYDELRDEAESELSRLAELAKARRRDIKALKAQLADVEHENGALADAVAAEKDKFERLSQQHVETSREVQLLREQAERATDAELALKTLKGEARAHEERARELEGRLEEERARRADAMDVQEDEWREVVRQRSDEARTEKRRAADLAAELEAVRARAATDRTELDELAAAVAAAVAGVVGAPGGDGAGIDVSTAGLAAAVRRLVESRNTLAVEVDAREQALQTRLAAIEDMSLRLRAANETADQLRGQVRALEDRAASPRKADDKALQLAERRARTLAAQLDERNALVAKIAARLSELTGATIPVPGAAAVDGGSAVSAASVLSEKQVQQQSRALLGALTSLDMLLASFADKVAASEGRVSRDIKKLDATLSTKAAKLDYLETIVAAASSSAAGSRLSSRRENSLDRLDGSVGAASVGAASSEKWAIRLQELEKRLKAEREARVRDRDGARQRLDEAMSENDNLKLMLTRERERNVNSRLGPVGFMRGLGFGSPSAAPSPPVLAPPLAGDRRRSSAGSMGFDDGIDDA
ncbi:uncharacterized protein V1510DRAFT_404482 [Dipodascopsis tothii]|uniref:uncharacterized protein n=1 Tax=Dipodascopsis tothii TaxID=44089 RepID=UPI0034CECFD9